MRDVLNFPTVQLAARQQNVGDRYRDIKKLAVINLFASRTKDLHQRFPCPGHRDDIPCPQHHIRCHFEDPIASTQALDKKSVLRKSRFRVHYGHAGDRGVFRYPVCANFKPAPGGGGAGCRTDDPVCLFQFHRVVNQVDAQQPGSGNTTEKDDADGAEDIANSVSNRDMGDKPGPVCIR